jgi:hypothetical protein
MTTGRENGFSLVELAMAVAVMLAVGGIVFALMDPSSGAFAVQGEAADMQQRLRVAADALSRELIVAGAGPSRGPTAGPLTNSFAAVLPYRRGTVREDPPGAFRPDAITLLYVPSTSAQTTIAADVTSPFTAFAVNVVDGCPIGLVACGFEPGDTVVVSDAIGSFETFTIASVDGNGGEMTANRPLGILPPVFRAGATIAKVVQRTYSLKHDETARLDQLIVYEGADGGDVPLVDHIVSLRFEYFGDPRPPRLEKSVDEPTGPWTTYGPTPPQADTRTTAYPAGENCTFTFDVAAGRHEPRLQDLAEDASAGLVPLPPSSLTDGPWCPDAESASRFDADLLRVRTVGVTLRVGAGPEGLRGPAGPLFARGGSARRAARWLVDQEVRFQISPRNLDLNR